MHVHSKMGKLNRFEILLSQPQGVFQAGQIVEGQVLMELNDEMKMRGKNILCHGNFSQLPVGF